MVYHTMREREIVSQVILQELLPVMELRDKIMSNKFIYFLDNQGLLFSQLITFEIAEN